MNNFFDFKGSIKNKLIGAFVSLTVVSLVLMSLIVYFKVVDQTKKDYIESIKKETTQLQAGIENYISLIKENTDMLARSSLIQGMDSRITSYVDKKGINGLNEMNPLQNDPYEAEVYKSFESFKSTHSEVDNVSIGVAQNGGYVQSPAKARNDGYDARTRDWYKYAISSPDKVVLSDLYTTSSGDMTLTASSVVKDSSNTIKGVLGLDINLKAIDNIIKNIKIGEKGYLIIVDKNGTIIVDQKEPSLVSKNVKDLKIAKLNNINNITTSFETKLADGKHYLINVGKPSNSTLEWSYISFIEKSDFMSSANNIGKITCILIAIFALISILITIFISNKISRPIHSIDAHLELMGKGDFHNELDPKYLKITDEIGRISNSTKKMQDSIKAMLLNVKENSMAIEIKAEDLHSSAQGVASSSGEVSSAIQDIAKGAGNQAQDLVDILNVLSTFGEGIQGITKSLIEIGENSKSINSMASVSDNNMNGLVESISKVGNTFKEFVSKIAILGQNVNKVNDITMLINNIAEQTNLLALNAAIEAARAGESGKGFAVVADEIRKLAQQSKSSAEDINLLLTNISDDTGLILKSSDDMDIELNNQVDAIHKGIDSFKEIVNAVEKIIPKIEMVSNSAEEMNKQKNTIGIRIENTSAISEETSAATEEIAASSEEMNAASEEVFSTVENLRELSKEMINQVNKFKL